MSDPDLDWLGELRWQGYPHLTPVHDASSDPEPPTKEAPPPPPDPRLTELARENEVMRGQLERLGKLAADFERRLRETGQSYENALLEAETRVRDAALDRERLSGELGAARAENARAAARDSSREADLRVERERRVDAEKALAVERARVAELAERAETLRAAAAEKAGAAAELRRQASDHAERLIQSKALTDQDVALLRQELREFLARLHKIQDGPGENR